MMKELVGLDEIVSQFYPSMFAWNVKLKVNELFIMHTC